MSVCMNLYFDLLVVLGVEWSLGGRCRGKQVVVAAVRIRAAARLIQVVVLVMVSLMA